MTSTTTHAAGVAETQGSVAARLISGLVSGDVSAVRGLYAGPGDIDDPAAGRQIDGGFERLVTHWAPAVAGRITAVEHRRSTSGAEGRFNGSEFHIALTKPDGTPASVDVVVISEFDTDGGLIRNRLYYRLARLTGVQHQRWRILPEEPVHVEEMLPGLQAYQDALRKGDPNWQADTFEEDGVFDGHGESQDLRDGLGMGVYRGREAIRTVLQQMFDIGDEEAGHDGDEHVGAIIEKLNIFSDGVSTVIEFNIVHENHPSNRTSAGVAVYDIGPNGLVQEARVYDEAW